MDNKKHPELKEGEEFVRNVFMDQFDSYEGPEAEKDKRLGVIAYSTSGNRLKDWRPLFSLLKGPTQEEVQRHLEGKAFRVVLRMYENDHPGTKNATAGELDAYIDRLEKSLDVLQNAAQKR